MSIALTYRLHFARALHSRPSALLWTGQTISALGDGAFVTALSWEALQLTGSAMDGPPFLVSALGLIPQPLPVPLCPATMASAQLPRQGIRTAVSEMREGLRYVAGSTFLWVTIALAALFTVGGAGSLVVALPKLVHDVYGQGVWLLGACPCRWWHRLTCRYSPRGASESFAQAR